MRVKCLQKGFDGRLRQPGEVFEYRGKKCPSWCTELENAGNVRSKDLTPASKAVAYLKQLNTEAELKAFLEGEERKGVKDEALVKLKEIRNEA